MTNSYQYTGFYVITRWGTGQRNSLPPQRTTDFNRCKLTNSIFKRTENTGLHYSSPNSDRQRLFVKVLLRKEAKINIIRQ